jgi:hypothetical protein
MPQHQSVPSVRVAQPPLSPVRTRAQFVAAPTCVGTLRLFVSPAAIPPLAPLPQHHSVPSLATAQVMNQLEAMLVASSEQLPERQTPLSHAARSARGCEPVQTPA